MLGARWRQVEHSRAARVWPVIYLGAQWQAYVPGRERAPTPVAVCAQDPVCTTGMAPHVVANAA